MKNKTILRTCLKLIIIIPLVSFGITTNIYSQKKMDIALSKFQKTKFMKKFHEIKIKAEGEIKVFQQEKDNYTPREIQKVKMAYNQTSKRFNVVLEDIKKDFLNRKKLKYIQTYPESYSKGLELDLRRLSDYYATHFQQVVRDVTGKETFGTPLLVLFPQLISFSAELIGQMKMIRQKRVVFSEQYLQQKLIQPNKFKLWEEIENPAHYDSFNDFEEDDFEEGNGDNEPLQGASRKKKKNH